MERNTFEMDKVRKLNHVAIQWLTSKERERDLRSQISGHIRQESRFPIR